MAKSSLLCSLSCRQLSNSGAKFKGLPYSELSLCQIFLFIPGDAFSSACSACARPGDCITGLSFLWFPFHFFLKSQRERRLHGIESKVGRSLPQSPTGEAAGPFYLSLLKSTALWSALSSCGSHSASGIAPFPFPFSLEDTGAPETSKSRDQCPSVFAIISFYNELIKHVNYFPEPCEQV